MAHSEHDLQLTKAWTMTYFKGGKKAQLPYHNILQTEDKP